MDDAANTAAKIAPAGWLDALARSEADLAAGHTVPGEAVMRRLRQTITEMEEAEVRRGWATSRPAVDLQRRGR